MIAAARALALIASVLLTNYANAQDGIVTYKSLSPELALDLARTALGDCRERGYQVAVAVVDRFGVTQVLLREASDRGDVVAQLSLRTGRCNFAWLLSNRPDEAQAQLTAASQTLGEGFHLPHVQVIVAQVNLDLYVGAAAQASRRSP